MTTRLTSDEMDALARGLVRSGLVPNLTLAQAVAIELDRRIGVAHLHEVAAQ